MREGGERREKVIGRRERKKERKYGVFKRKIEIKMEVGRVVIKGK